MPLTHLTHPTGRSPSPSPLAEGTDPPPQRRLRPRPGPTSGSRGGEGSPTVPSIRGRVGSEPPAARGSARLRDAAIPRRSRRRPPAAPPADPRGRRTGGDGRSLEGRRRSGCEGRAAAHGDARGGARDADGAAPRPAAEAEGTERRSAAPILSPRSAERRDGALRAAETRPRRGPRDPPHRRRRRSVALRRAPGSRTAGTDPRARPRSPPPPPPPATVPIPAARRPPGARAHRCPPPGRPTGGAGRRRRAAGRAPGNGKSPRPGPGRPSCRLRPEGERRRRRAEPRPRGCAAVPAPPRCGALPSLCGGRRSPRRCRGSARSLPRPAEGSRPAHTPKVFSHGSFLKCAGRGGAERARSGAAGSRRSPAPGRRPAGAGGAAPSGAVKEHRSLSRTPRPAPSPRGDPRAGTPLPLPLPSPSALRPLLSPHPGAAPGRPGTACAVRVPALKRSEREEPEGGGPAASAPHRSGGAQPHAESGAV